MQSRLFTSACSSTGSSSTACPWTRTRTAASSIQSSPLTPWSQSTPPQKYGVSPVNYASRTQHQNQHKPSSKSGPWFWFSDSLTSWNSVILFELLTPKTDNKKANVWTSDRSSWVHWSVFNTQSETEFIESAQFVIQSGLILSHAHRRMCVCEAVSLSVCSLIINYSRHNWGCFQALKVEWALSKLQTSINQISPSSSQCFHIISQHIPVRAQLN